MALSIITGSSGTVDVSIGGASYKCVLNYWTADENRQFDEQTTFCSEEWVEETPIRRQLVGVVAGYLSKGSAISNPSLHMDDLDGVAMVLTADTGCTRTFTAHMGQSHTAIRAAASSEFAYAYRSTGPVVTAWVVA